MQMFPINIIQCGHLKCEDQCLIPQLNLSLQVIIYHTGYIRGIIDKASKGGGEKVRMG